MNSTANKSLCAGFAVLILFSANVAWAGPSAASVPAPTLPLRFEQGAVPSTFLSAGHPGTLYFSRGAVQIRSREGLAGIRVVGGRAVDPQGEAPFSFTTNYFHGADPSKWRTRVVSYARVRYPEILDGIDLVFHGTAGRMEFDFEIAPGTDPGVLEFRLDGFSGLSAEESGHIRARLDSDEYHLEPPVAFQEIDGRRSTVACAFRLEGEVVSFALGEYDTNRTLVIDPIFVLGSYLGGAQQDSLAAVATDPQGNLYVAGTTESRALNSGAALQPNQAGGRDILIAKLSGGGSTLLWATYLGGAGDEDAGDIALDSAGNIYVTGGTNSIDFPVQSAFQPARAGNTDAFVSKLNNSGSQLIYSTYLGGGASDVGYAIALDGNEVVVTGPTSSTNFHVVGAYQSTRSGGSEAFLARLSGNGSQLISSTYYGGTGNETPIDVVLTKDGHMVIAGVTTSNTGLPLEQPLQENRSGSSDAFIAEFSPDGRNLLFGSYLGGTGAETAYSVASDDQGRIWVLGETGSANFPVADPIQAASAGGNEMFLSVIDSTGPELVFSSYLGGSGSDSGRELLLDPFGRAVVAGISSSLNFPLAGTAFLRRGGSETVVAVLDIERTSLVFSSFVGGSAVDLLGGMALGPTGTIYLAGTTNSLDFPARNPYPNQGSFNGSPVYRTTTGGTSWGVSRNGLDVTGVDVLHVAPRNLWVYAGTASGAIYLSRDQGNSWESAGNVSGQVLSIATDPQDAAVVYVGTSQALFRSDNAGENWTTVCGSQFMQCTSFTAVVVDPSNRNLVYAGTASNGVFWSEQRGERESWRVRNGSPELPDAGKAVYSLAIDPRNTSTFFLGGNGTVYKTTDRGATWNPTSLAGVGPVRNLVVAGDSTVYATGFVSGAGNIVARSTNGGGEWKAPPAPGAPVALAVHPTSPASLFVGISGGGVQKSTNSGEDWQELNNDLKTRAVNDLVIDPGSPNRMYLASLDVSDGYVAGLQPANTFYFPQVAAGTVGRIQFQTSFILVNTGPDSEVTIELFNSEGQPMEMTIEGLGTSSVFELVIPSGGAFFGESSGEEVFKDVGYARITAGPGVDGTAVFERTDLLSKHVLFEAGVPATKAAGDFVFILDSLGDNDTGIALVNAADGTPGEPNPAEVELALYDGDGNLIDEATVGLRRGHHRARFVHQLFPNAVQQAREMRGLVTVTSPVPLVALTLRQRDHEQKEFPQEVASLTPFPVVGPLNLSRVLYFPQVANGPAGIGSPDRFKTDFVVANPGILPINVVIEFFDSGGSPIAFRVDGGNPTNRLQFSLAGRRFRVIETASPSEGTLLFGYARLTASSPTVGGTAIFSQTSSQTTVFEAGVAATTPRRRFTVFLDSIGFKDTGLALVNPGQDDAEITVRLYDLESNLLGEAGLDLASGGHRSNFIYQMFSGNARTQAQEMRGVVTVESNVPIAALTLRQKDQPGVLFPQEVPTLTTFPVIPGTFE